MAHTEKAGEAIDVNDVTRKLEAAGLEPERAEHEGLAFVSVRDRYGNAVSIYEDGIVVLGINQEPWDCLLFAADRATEGLVVRGMRKHADEHGCEDYRKCAELVEHKAEAWDFIAAMRREAGVPFPDDLTPREILESLLHASEIHGEGQSYSA